MNTLGGGLDAVKSFGFGEIRASPSVFIAEADA